LARLDKGMEPVARFSPIFYYQSGDAIEGLNCWWLTGLGMAAALFVALAWWCFERRDIRVVGEGGWRLPRRRARAAGCSEGEASAYRSFPTARDWGYTRLVRFTPPTPARS